MRIWRWILPGDTKQVGYRLPSPDEEFLSLDDIGDLAAQGVIKVDVTPATWDAIRVAGEAVSYTNESRHVEFVGAELIAGPIKRETCFWYWIDQ